MKLSTKKSETKLYMVGKTEKNKLHMNLTLDKKR